MSTVLKSSKTTTPRLRDACDNCNAAKLRCSGERDGCQRCQKLSKACVYRESRVGKNPGLRAKRKPSVPKGDQIQELQDNYSAVVPASPAVNDIQHEVFLSTSGLGGSPMDCFSDDWTAGGMDDFDTLLNSSSKHDHLQEMKRFCDTGYTPSINSINGIDSHLSNIDSGYATDTFDIMTFSSQLPTPPELPSPTPPELPSPMPQGSGYVESKSVPLSLFRRGIDDKCLMICTRLIGDLQQNSVAQAPNLSIAKILNNVKKTRRNLSEAIDSRENATDFCSLAAFSIIVFQMTVLLERACDALEQQNTIGDTTNGVDGRPGAQLPTVLLGDIEMDADTQIEIYSQLLLLELRESQKAVRRIELLDSTDVQQGRDERWITIYDGLKQMTARVRSLTNMNK